MAMLPCCLACGHLCRGRGVPRGSLLDSLLGRGCVGALVCDLGGESPCGRGLAWPRVAVPARSPLSTQWPARVQSMQGPVHPVHATAASR